MTVVTFSDSASLVKTGKASSSDFTRFKKLQAQQRDLIIDKNKFRTVLSKTNLPVKQNFLNGLFSGQINHNTFGAQSYSARKPK